MVINRQLDNLRNVIQDFFTAKPCEHQQTVIQDSEAHFAWTERSVFKGAEVAKKRGV